MMFFAMKTCRNCENKFLVGHDEFVDASREQHVK